MTELAIAGVALFGVAVAVLAAAYARRGVHEVRTIRRIGLRRRLEVFVAENTPEPPETRTPH